MGIRCLHRQHGESKLLRRSRASTLLRPKLRQVILIRDAVRGRSICHPIAARRLDASIVRSNASAYQTQPAKMTSSTSKGCRHMRGHRACENAYCASRIGAGLYTQTPRDAGRFSSARREQYASAHTVFLPRRHQPPPAALSLPPFRRGPWPSMLTLPPARASGLCLDASAACSLLSHAMR